MDLQRRYRRKHRGVWTKRIAVALFVIIVVTLLICGFFWIPYFRISRVDITGLAATDTVSQIIFAHMAGKNAWWLPYDSFFLVSSADIEEVLKKEEFGAPQVSKSFPHSLSVMFTEQKPEYIMCAGEGDCYYLNRFGVPFTIAPNFSDSPLPLISWSKDSISRLGKNNVLFGNPVLSNTVSGFLNDFSTRFRAAGFTIKKIELGDIANASLPADAKEAKLFTGEGWYVFVNTGLAPETVFNDLKLLLDQKVGSSRALLNYVDLRFSNRAFYMLRQ